MQSLINPKPLHSFKDNTGVTVWRAFSVWERRKDDRDFMNFLIPPQCTVNPETEVKTWTEHPRLLHGQVCEDQLLLNDGLTIDVLQIVFDKRKIWFDPVTNSVYE